MVASTSCEPPSPQVSYPSWQARQRSPERGPRLALAPVSRFTAVDLFAGAGGASCGLRRAGFDIIAAVEVDGDSAATYSENHPDTLMYAEDIRNVDPLDVMLDAGIGTQQLDLLKACPPCQGFSTLGKCDPEDPRNDLIGEVWRFVSAFQPRAVLLENVPGLKGDTRLRHLIRQLRSVGYGVRHYVENAVDFGVAQTRRRLIVVAVRHIPRTALPETIRPAHRRRRSTVGDVLKRAPRKDDPLRRHRKLAPATLKRVRAIPIGGGRFDLPAHMRLDCHKNLTGHDATASYGRLRTDAPAPTITTRCTTPACGRFVHPSKNRGLTLREAALLQSFPRRYVFIGGYDSIERQIGNALPPPMATAAARIVAALLRKGTR
jgi:DNA (cytosine-5)-methyltransferase 1